MSDLFRAEAIAARRDLAGPGRLLGRPRLGRLWVLLAALAAAVAVLGLAVPVDSYATGSAHVDARSGAVAGVVRGAVSAGPVRVTPAGGCAAAEVPAGLMQRGAVSQVSAVLPARCRGRGGPARVAVPAGREPLLIYLWRQLA